jgi:hypothetical protein
MMRTHTEAYSSKITNSVKYIKSLTPFGSSLLSVPPNTIEPDWGCSITTSANTASILPPRDSDYSRDLRVTLNEMEMLNHDHSYN